MIPIERKTDFIQSGAPVRTMKLRVSASKVHKLIPLLRDSLYSNKILTPIREYSTNAWDAHIEADIQGRPIEVTLPSRFEPELKIRDFGKGLTLDEMDEIYVQYLESTKDTSNAYNGMFGLGSKSAFAYGDMFVVVSRCQGQKHIMTLRVDGDVSVDYSGSSDGEEDGLEVTIPVDTKDADNFITAALDFYKYWTVPPTIKNCPPELIQGQFGPIQQKAMFSGNGWRVLPGKSRYNTEMSVALTGQVPYPIDWRIVRNNRPAEISSNVLAFLDFLTHNSTILEFDNGTVSYTPNRESLQYTEQTISEIFKKVEEIYTAVLKIVEDKISSAKNLWDAMVIYNKVFSNSNSHSVVSIDEDGCFAGDTSAIERALKGRLKWNDIEVQSGNIRGLFDWSASEGNTEDRYRSQRDPIGCFYTKADDKLETVNTLRISRHKNTTISANETTAILVYDKDSFKLKARAAAYLMYKLMPQMKRVFVVNLEVDEVRSAFYKEYNLDHIPHTKISDIMTEVKEYASKFRSKKGNGGSNLGRPTGPISAKYVSLNSIRYRSKVELIWGSEDVTVKSLEGGVYVVYDKGNIAKDGGAPTMDATQSIRYIEAFKTLVSYLGIDVTKIHGLHRRTVNSIWFQEARAEGEWKSIDDMLLELESDIPFDEILSASSFVEKLSERSNENRLVLGRNISKKLLKALPVSDTVLYKYLLHVDTLKDVEHLSSIVSMFFPSKVANYKDTINYNVTLDQIDRSYPMLHFVNFQTAFQSNSIKDDYYSVKDTLLSTIVSYINAMDGVAKEKTETELTTV